MYIVDPFWIVQVPGNGFLQAVFKGMRRFPAQFSHDSITVDGIAEIMAGPVCDKMNESVVRAIWGGAQGVKCCTYGADDLDVRALGMPADVICPPRKAVLKHGVDSRTMIFHMQPVADVFPCAIDWQRFFSQRIQDDKRNQFFRKLAGAVIV